MPPTIAIAFAPTAIPVGGVSSLTFTIGNPTAATMTGVAVTDTLPSGLRVMTSSGAACGGTRTVTKPSTISLSGGALAPGGSCHFSIDVYGFEADGYTVSTGPVSSSDAVGSTATANLSVWAPPVPTLRLGASTVRIGGSTVLTIDIASPHPFASAITGINATIDIPAGVSVATVNPDVCGGVFSNVAGGLRLAGANLPAGTYCHFQATLTGRAAGTYTLKAVVSVGSYTYDGNTTTTRLTVSAPAPPPPAPTPTPTPTPAPVITPESGITPSPGVAAVDVPTLEPTSGPADAGPGLTAPSAGPSVPVAAPTWPSSGGGSSSTALPVFGALALLVAGVIALAVKRQRVAQG